MLTDLALPHPLSGTSTAAEVRRATRDDRAALVALLADDAIAAGRGDADLPDDPSYARAMDAVLASPDNELLVVEVDGAVAATAQLTRVPCMARRGATRLIVEAVRVGAAHRSSGLGSALFGWIAEHAAPALGASIVQLTTDRRREDAHRFYERLGYEASHVGFTLLLDADDRGAAGSGHGPGGR